MKVLKAKTAGFCFGVRRAVEMVTEQSRNGRLPVYTYGPIIHNDQVVRELEQKGVRVLDDLEQLKEIREGTLIIRSHGVSRREQQIMEESGLTIVDATCPFVKKIHRIAEQAGRDGRTLVIAGDPSHPEVKGIIGWASGRAEVIDSPESAKELRLSEKEEIVLAAQTTFHARKFENIVEILRERGYDNLVMNTVCSATDERQTEARKLACQVDAMIVVGGRHSSNTRKLYEICKENCGNTYLIETLDDLDLKPFQSFLCVGITAGASTPNSIIEEVTDYVRTKL
ncbi:MAG: 4-hydroxy-3-methylbut-2-enyl diphosphate reductase [Eubacterium sp.]|nr:4-hydroxy-3-methylbut-2-enyl diphosphate reductase [Eubacterium sp.]